MLKFTKMTYSIVIHEKLLLFQVRKIKAYEKTR